MALPQATPLTTKTVFSLSFNRGAGAQMVHVDRYTIEVSASGKIAFVRSEVLSQGANMALGAIYVSPSTISYAEFTALSLPNMNTAKWLALIGALVAPIITIIAWVVLYRNMAFSGKWIWAIAIAVSICQFHLRWPDGAWVFQPLSLNLLGIGAVRSTYPIDGPWMLHIAFPVFALYVIFQDRKARRLADSGGWAM